MEYNYVITHEKIREWKKENFGVEFDKILQSFLDLKSEIKNGPGKSSRLKDDFYLTKHVGKHSRPTLVWLRLVNEDTSLDRLVEEAESQIESEED